MQNDDAVVRLLTLGGVWEQVGTGAWAGYTPESITASANKNGSDTCSFTLKRDPTRGGAMDLKAFSPVELEVGGVVVWEGYVWETPSSSGPDSMQISVSARGWQYTLDDDTFTKQFVHSSLGDLNDMRSFPGYDTSSWLQAFTVTNDGGGIVLGIANGQVLVNVSSVGVVLDAGPNNLFKYYTLDYDWNNQSGNGNMGFFIEGADSVLASSWNGSGSGTMTAGTGGSTVGGTSINGGTGNRFLRIRWTSLAGGNFTLTGDIVFRINKLSAYGEQSYVNTTTKANQLYAGDIISTMLSANALTQLSSSTSLISATSFPIPDFSVAEPKTVREIIDAANAYHNYRVRVVPGKQLSFSAQPSVALLETRDGPGSSFNDTSANAGEDLFNRVLVTGQGPDGTNLLVDRRSTTSLLNGMAQPPSPYLSNFAFPSNITGWGGSASTVWASAIGHTANGSIQVGNPGVGEAMPTVATATFSQVGTVNFKKGVTYVLRWWARYGTLTFPFVMGGTFGALGAGDQTDFGQVPVYAGGATTGTAPLYVRRAGNIINFTDPANPDLLQTNWSQYQTSWTPAQDYAASSVTLRFYGQTLDTGPTNRLTYFDDIQLFQGQTTLLDRWGRVRTATLPVSSPGTAASYTQLGDTFLTTKAKTPFKGEWTLGREGAAWTATDGAPMHPAHALLMSSELVRFADQIDPDSGAVGRDGYIAAASYTHDSRTLQASIDNTRSDFEALLSRLAIITQSRVRY